MKSKGFLKLNLFLYTISPAGSILDNYGTERLLVFDRFSLAPLFLSEKQNFCFWTVGIQSSQYPTLSWTMDSAPDLNPRTGPDPTFLAYTGTYRQCVPVPHTGTVTVRTKQFKLNTPLFSLVNTFKAVKHVPNYEYISWLQNLDVALLCTRTSKFLSLLI